MGTYLSNPTDNSVTLNNIKAAAEAADGGAGLVFMDNVLINNSYHMGLNAASDKQIPAFSYGGHDSRILKAVLYI